jgi:hypothetical protein
MKVGDKLARTNLYVLRRRSEKQPNSEVKKAFEGVKFPKTRP